jgi:Secretion system C-terminal sorting domain
MKLLLLILAFVTSVIALPAQNVSKPDLSVFPNPAADYICVQDNNDLVGHLAVVSMTGRRVKEFEFSKGEHYSIVDLPKGMYLVQILDRNKQVLTTQKLNKR